MVEALIGVLGGVLVGATGAGVGLLVTPLLVLAGHPPMVAIGTGLGILVVSKFIGALLHGGLGHWPSRGVWILVAGGAGGAALAWWIGHTWLEFGSPEGSSWLQQALGVMLLAAALGLMATNDGGISRIELPRAKHPTALFVIGVGTGVPVTLTSLGSGSLLVPVLVLLTDWTVPQLAAASNLFGWVVGGVGLALFSKAGYLEWGALARVLLGLLPGLAIGVFLSRHIARRWFALGIGISAVYVGIRLLGS